MVDILLQGATMDTMQRIFSAATSGGEINRQEAVALVTAELPSLLYYAGRLREHFKGNRVNLCSIVNAKSGSCPENCRFCAQSGHSRAGVPSYPLLGGDAIAAAMEKAAANGAECFGIVTSGRRLSHDDVATLASLIPRISSRGIRLSASLGELDGDTLRALKASGLVRFHHNLETAESFFPNVCTTHRYADRVATVRRAKEAGLEVCSGGIFGLGETFRERIELAFALRELDVDSVPLNFLNPVRGTPMERQAPLPVADILRTIALFRFVLPAKDISVCGGREVNLRDMQSWIFHAGANGMMVGGYLTTGGRAVEQDLKMIEDLGLKIN